MNAIEQVLGLVSPPKQPVAAGTPEAFARIEKELGLTLPADYKSLVSTYGDGQWQEFWFLLNPFSPNKFLNLLEQSPREDASGNNLLSAERYIRNRHAYPHPIWPEPGGIFPWGVTDNGGRFFWVLQGPPEGWHSVYYPSRDPGYQDLNMSISEIIEGLLSGELPLFRDEFDGEVPPPTEAFRSLPVSAG